MGLRAIRQRGDFRRPDDPDRLATAPFAAIQGGLLLTLTRGPDASKASLPGRAKRAR